MRTRFAATGRASHHRALVGLRELDLARLGVAAEALHLHDPPLALHRLLPDHRSQEQEHDRDAEEEAGEVERGAEDRADDQDGDDGYGYLHGGGSLLPLTAGRSPATQVSVSRWLRSVPSRASNVSSLSSPAPSTTGRISGSSGKLASFAAISSTLPPIEPASPAAAFVCASTSGSGEVSGITAPS